MSHICTAIHKTNSSTKITNHHGRGYSRQVYMIYQGNQLHVHLVECLQYSADPVNQGSGAWPYAG